MTRQEQRHSLVAHLLIGHKTAIILVPGTQQHGEQVTPLLFRTPSLLDHLVNRGIQASNSLANAPVARCWPVVGNVYKPSYLRAKTLHGDLERLTQFLGLPQYVRVKERLAHDPESQTHHLASNIDSLSISPPLLDLLTIVHHNIRVRGNATMLKSGCNKPALSLVELVLTGK